MRIARAAVALGWLLAIAGLIALGTWQVHRRAWKLDLIAQVDARIHAEPVPAPAAAGPADAYRRIVARGAYLVGRDTLVQASTDLGAGWWVLTPLRTESGRIILINRGYVADKGPHPAPSCPRGPACGTGLSTVTGLLRLTEPDGGFLRTNDQAGDHWYSRDVAAIAARRGVVAAPYFIDADATANAPDQPVGGLTVIRFPNNHLVYAITWYTLAAMAAFGFFYWLRLDRAGRGA